MKHRLFTVSLAALVISVFAINASAQNTPVPPADLFKINYFANNVSGAPDATVRLDNAGTATVNLCAHIYVFQDDQQLTECCDCLLTPDGLRTFSVGKDLTSNPLTGPGTTPPDGMIMIFATNQSSSNCALGESELLPGLRGWGTHIQNKVGSAYPVTETPFSDVTANVAEFDDLIHSCSFAQHLGSGKGVCTCGTGD